MKSAIYWKSVHRLGRGDGAHHRNLRPIPILAEYFNDDERDDNQEQQRSG
jgi:hypothetical protein